jgi:hypothetical protein
MIINLESRALAIGNIYFKVENPYAINLRKYGRFKKDFCHVKIMLFFYMP